MGISRRAFLGGAAAAFVVPPGRARAAGIGIHLCGDSIFKGYALKNFTPALSPADPLYPFRSIASMGNLVLQENAAPASFDYLNAGVGTMLALQQIAAQGIIRDGDWVIFEDAGDHPADLATYKQSWCDSIAAICHPGVNIAVLTMFDYPGTPSSLYRYDSGSPSANDVIREVAAETGATLIDENASMDAWRVSAYQTDHVSVMHADGIHPNVWGQMRILGDIIGATGLHPFVLSCRSLEAIAAENYKALAYGGGVKWKPERAAAYCRYLLKTEAAP